MRLSVGKRSGSGVLQDEKTLAAHGVRVHFGGVKALDGVDLALNRGDVLGLIGPNGAGKTTLVNVLTGYQRVTEGRVVLGSLNVTGWDASRLARRGIARTFQGVRLFNALSVHENVEVGAVGVGRSRGDARRVAADLLRRMQLSEKARLPASSLAHGEARRLGILRALATEPTFLLLDEPGAGLNEREVDELVESLMRVRNEFGCGLLVIEHDMRLIMQLCELIQVLDYGRTISVGPPAAIRNDPAVLTAYLGSPREPQSRRN